MDSWHATCLGLRHRPELKLALALQMGFLRMNGRLLEAVRIVPPLLWKQLGTRVAVDAPDLASLRTMYRRAPTMRNACSVRANAHYRPLWLCDRRPILTS